MKRMKRLKRITAINVNPFLTKIDFHVAKNTKILTFPWLWHPFSRLFPNFFKIAVFSWLRDPQIPTFPDRMNPASGWSPLVGHFGLLLTTDVTHAFRHHRPMPTDFTNAKIGDQPTASVESAMFCRLGWGSSMAHGAQSNTREHMWISGTFKLLNDL